MILFRPPPSDRGPTWLAHRLCGLPGDLIEIRKGTLYVNGDDADKRLKLMHVFKVNRSDSGSIRHDPALAYSIPSYPGIVYVTLDDRYARELQLSCERHILPPGARNESIHKTYKKNWNEDNFGPIKVPRGQWFVLGDNRSHACDSRHFGFIGQCDYAGVVL